MLGQKHVWRASCDRHAPLSPKSSDTETDSCPYTHICETKWRCIQKGEERANTCVSSSVCVAVVDASRPRSPCT